MNKSPLVKGIVECFDENNNLLFTKENMIVKSGRKKIIQSLFEDGSIDVMYAGISSSSALTEPDMSFDDVYQSYSNGLTISCTPVESETSSTSTDDISDSELIREYEIIKEPLVNASDTDSISSLYLYFKEGSGSNAKDVLFSRVTFPKYPNSLKLKFKYKIYF